MLRRTRVGAGTTDEAGASPASNSQDHGLGNMGSGASDTPGLAGSLGLVAGALAVAAVTLRRRELRG